MGYIYDVQSKWVGSYGDTQKRNPYYEGYLAEWPRNVVEGYDIATKDVKAFFQSDRAMKNLLYELGLKPDRLDRSAVKLGNPDQGMNLETRVAFFVARALEMYLNRERNDLVIWYLDSMTESEYNEGYARVWGKKEGE